MRVVMPRIVSGVGCFLNQKQHQHQAVCISSCMAEDLPSGAGNLEQRGKFFFFGFCDCVTFEGDLSSASRLARSCSVGAEHGVVWQMEQVAKGRPLPLMRINGRSGSGVSLCCAGSKQLANGSFLLKRTAMERRRHIP